MTWLLILGWGLLVAGVAALVAVPLILSSMGKNPIRSVQAMRETPASQGDVNATAEFLAWLIAWETIAVAALVSGVVIVIS